MDGADCEIYSRFSLFSRWVLIASRITKKYQEANPNLRIGPQCQIPHLCTFYDFSFETKKKSFLITFY